MKRFRIISLCALAAGTTFVAAPASAQRVGRIVAFGDSYADTGNFFALTGIPRPAVYANGRFSNGTNFVDTMSQILGVRDDNFAIGGAFTGPGNSGFFNISGPGLPGLPTEIQSFLAGGGPAAFPRVTGTFAPSDLVVVSIGGNDGRFYEMKNGPAPSSATIAAAIAGAPAAANISVGEATAGLNSLVNAGARNITFLAGDVGRLPEVTGSPIAPIGTAFASSFNTGIQSSLAGFASRGVIVNYLDLNRIGDVVAANLSAFGLQSAGACPIACVTTNPELLDKYLFYVDKLHLTSAGFAIIGRYAVRQLEAPLQLQAQGEAGLQAATSFGSTLSGRLDLSATRAGAERNGLAFYVTGNAASRNVRATNTSLPYRVDTVGVTAGAEYEAAGATIGIAANYARPRADMTTATGAVEAHAWQVGAYGGWAGGGGFVQGYAGYGRLHYRIRRTAVIDDIHARPSGTAVTAGGKAGFLFGAGGLRIGPVVALDYGRVRINAYTESGDPVLTLNVQSQKADVLLGSAGVEARGDLSSGGLSIRPYLAVTVDKDLRGDGRTILYAETTAPTIVNRFALANRGKDTYGRVTGGASLSLGGNLSLQVQGSGSFKRKGGNDFGGFAGLKVGF